MRDIDMDAVRAMRAEGRTHKEIAAVFGCSRETIMRRLVPAIAERERERYKQTEKARRQANPERGRQASRKWSAANPEKQRTAARRRYAANPEVQREYNRRYREANGEVYKANKRAKYAANPELFRERMRRHRAENPEIYAERAREARQRRRKDLQFRFAVARGQARRAHARKGVPFEDIGLEALCARDGWTCQICGGSVDREIVEFQHPWGMSFDHIIPESKGGGWTWGNLQLTHRGCNIMRGDRPLDEARAFAREFLKRLAA